jgi:hypothetical protein
MAANTARLLLDPDAPFGTERLDGRTKAGKHFGAIKQELTEYVGCPDQVQKGIIGRAAWLSLRLAQYDTRIADGERFTRDQAREYLAWCGMYVQLLAALKLGLGYVESLYANKSLAASGF